MAKNKFAYVSLHLFILHMPVSMKHFSEISQTFHLCTWDNNHSSILCLNKIYKEINERIPAKAFFNRYYVWTIISTDLFFFPKGKKRFPFRKIIFKSCKKYYSVPPTKILNKAEHFQDKELADYTTTYTSSRNQVQRKHSVHTLVLHICCFFFCDLPDHF